MEKGLAIIQDTFYVYCIGLPQSSKLDLPFLDFTREFPFIIQNNDLNFYRFFSPSLVETHIKARNRLRCNELAVMCHESRDTGCCYEML